MTESRVPQIFSSQRRSRRELRSKLRQRGNDNPVRFLWDDVADDMAERLAFIRHEPDRSLLVGDAASDLRQILQGLGGTAVSTTTLDPENPFAKGEYDFIGVGGIFDAINDLPGALIHINTALAPGGLAIVSFIGGASLPRLRAAMLAGDGDRPAARIHPMVDPRAAPQLLQRAAWKDPVVDTHTLTVRYSSLDQLVHDLRDHGLTSALSDRAPPLGKAALAKARAAFLNHADPDGKVSETFEIITLTGRRSLSGT